MASKFDYDAFTDFYDGHTLLAVNQLENNLKKATAIAADADTIEAEPVRHGHWIEKLTTIQCSNCGKEYNDEIRCMCYAEDAELKHCPRCGAKMEENE